MLGTVHVQISNTETFELGALEQLAIMGQCKLTTFWEIKHQALRVYFKGLGCNVF